MPAKSDTPRNIGPYEIVGALGKGGMGDVYKAVDPSTKKIVALKVLSQDFLQDETRLERFHREAEALSALHHPNVVRLLDKGQDGDQLYFVMEYVQGTSLAALLRRRRLSLPEVLTVFKAICAGLEAAHQESIIHRDLNPRNILVADDLSVIKLADFGISRVESLSRALGTLATVEFSMGTMHYVAPEQTEDMATIDHRADIYSAGVMLHEMLTGRVPIGRFNLPSQLNSEVPPELDPIVLKCLASEPAARYATVGQLRDRLRSLEDQLRLGVVNELRGISRSTSKIFRRGTQTLALNKGKRFAAVAGIATLMALAIGVGLLIRRSTDSGGSASSLDSAETPEMTLSTEEGVILGEVPGAPPSAAQESPEAAVSPATPTPTSPPQTQHTTPPATGRRAAAEQRLRRGAEAASRAAETAQRDLQVARDKVEAKLYAPALEDLQTFVESYPNSSLLPDAYLVIAEIHENENRFDDALATLVELQSRFGESPRATEALFRRGQLTLTSRKKGGEAEARQLFAELARDYSDSEWAPQALAAKAAIERHQKISQVDPELGRSVPAALVTQRQLVERYPEHPSVEAALWNLGATYKDLKRFELAAAAYADLATRFPETRFAAWWETAQIYDKRLDNKDEALAAYKRLPSGSAHYDAAQKRIKRLEKR